MSERHPILNKIETRAERLQRIEKNKKARMRRARKLIEYMMTDEETVDNHKEVFEGIIQAAVEQAEPVRKKNKYKKDPNNPRWNTTNNNG